MFAGEIELNSRSKWVYVTARYGTAIASTLLAFWLRSMLQPWLGDECPFSLFYLSVLLTAWLSGTGPACLAIGLGTISAAYFFYNPHRSIYIEAVPEIVQLSIYVTVNLIATLLFDRLERQKRLAERRSIENERLSCTLRESDERKDEFLALLAHELRNPLAPIRSSLTLLEKQPGSLSTIIRVRDIISRQTNQLIRLTDDLLDVARFSRGHFQLQLCRFDLREAVNDAVEMCQGHINEKSHHFQLLMPSKAIWVKGDRVRLAQSTTNLLSNAVKYTHPGGRITIHLELFDNLVAIAVSDNGIGFSPCQSENILQPFMQIDTSRTREYGGLGLGLAIVNQLVKLHGGSLNVFSRGPGMGSCFTIRLPLDNQISQTTMLATPLLDCEKISDAQLHRAPNFRKVSRLLLVEDNPDASELLSELLRWEGFEVDLAKDGIEALQLVTLREPDTIILDIGLPGMDGYEVARKIRRMLTENPPLLIALTGWGGPVDRDRAVAAGFDCHIVKPVDFQELLKSIRAPFLESSPERMVYAAGATTEKD